MEENKLVENYIEKVQTIFESYSKYDGFVDGRFLQEYQNEMKQFRNNITAATEENRKLRIGIVGQIKAGKSSFLNALLFDGQDVLPKAATPMTAALTVVSYADRPYAKVEFYTNEEWELILEKSREYHEVLLEAAKVKPRSLRFLSTNKNKDEEKKQNKKRIVTPDLQSAHELVEMVKKNNIDVSKYLGEKETIEGVDSTQDLIGKLENYVGANGTFTPIVKSSELYVPNEMLRDVEVVDTPGVNDPIISRGQRTREYLGKCDVVFLLSYSGQFMDVSDVELLTQNIPNKGIRNIVLLGSKFDSLLVDASGKVENFSQALQIATKQLDSHARRLISGTSRGHVDNELLQSLKKSLPPMFISSVLYSIAHKKGKLTAEETLIEKNLKNAFPTMNFTKEVLLDFSNIDRVKEEKLETIKSKKEDILRKRLGELVEAQKVFFVKKLQEMNQEVQLNYNQMQDASEEGLKQQKLLMEKMIDGMRMDVENVFGEEITKKYNAFLEYSKAYEEIVLAQKGIEIRNEKKPVKTGTERYGFFWLNKRDVFETKSFTYANVHQVIENIEELVNGVERQMIEDFKVMTQLDELKKDIRFVLNKNMEKYKEDEDFQAEQISRTVNSVMRTMRLPWFNLDTTTYREMVVGKFGFSRVEGDDVEELEEMQWEIIYDILDDIENELDEKSKLIINSFEEMKQEFLNQVLQKFNEKIENFSNQIKEVEKNKVIYENLLATITKDIDTLETDIFVRA